MSKIIMSYEIAMAFCSSEADAGALKASPKAYIESTYGVTLDFANIEIVENTASCVNIVLPYYDSDFDSPALVSDINLSGDAYGEAVAGAKYRPIVGTPRPQGRHNKVTGQPK